LRRISHCWCQSPECDVTDSWTGDETCNIKENAIGAELSPELQELSQLQDIYCPAAIDEYLTDMTGVPSAQGWPKCSRGKCLSSSSSCKEYLLDQHPHNKKLLLDTKRHHHLCHQGAQSKV
jgi:hypothetical protein